MPSMWGALQHMLRAIRGRRQNTWSNATFVPERAADVPWVTLTPFTDREVTGRQITTLELYT